ncbi:MAG: ABC transporter substrate-binding protein [Tateyamaria sp.]|uniref:ABC transporter substrate-binding protein n=1 Tax=Tateyamaria sp. TaxID=1929288 RepID=UPI00329E5F07
MKLNSIFGGLCLVALWMFGQPVQADTELFVGYLKVEVPRPATLSNLDEVPENLGLAGVETGLQDNLTTGKFLKQTYTLNTNTVFSVDDPVATAKTMLAQSPYLILDAPADVLLQIADLTEAKDALIFNATAADVALRDKDCRANVLHSQPSYAMRTDALAQLLVKKRWSDLVMIEGTYPKDAAYAAALRRSLTKYGLKLSDSKIWDANADMRRTASQEIPLFTQDFGDYDALLLADEVQDFGRFVLYNTWHARPVVGSEGLSALTWSPVIEQWGAAQLQNRFRDEHARSMRSADYAGWAAMRTLGEAVTRTNKTDVATLRAYILSDAFELAGFKGRPLTYRTWNGQLRQPIALAHPRALVAQAPLEGFLHQTNEMDSLGLDHPESTCEAFQ